MSERGDRRPPVPLDVLYGLPSTYAFTFVLAATEGKGMSDSYDYTAYKRGRPVPGVRIGKDARDRVLQRTGHSRDHWDRATAEWIAHGLAHRCRRGRIFLFLVPPADGLCFDCDAALHAVSTPHHVRHDTAPRAANHVQNGEATEEEQGSKAVGGVGSVEQAAQLAQKFSRGAFKIGATASESEAAANG